MIDKFKNFGELYRAAYAGAESEQKLLLLGEVQRKIREWEQAQQTNENPSLAALAAKPCASETATSWAGLA